jgi:hypothetical protein
MLFSTQGLAGFLLKYRPEFLFEIRYKNRDSPQPAATRRRAKNNKQPMDLQAAETNDSGMKLRIVSIRTSEMK